jgi:hypothetical protein
MSDKSDFNENEKPQNSDNKLDAEKKLPLSLRIEIRERSVAKNEANGFEIDNKTGKNLMVLQLINGYGSYPVLVLPHFNSWCITKLSVMNL